MSHQTILKRTNDVLDARDSNWLIAKSERSISNTVEQEESIHFSVSVRDRRHSYLYGRYCLDVAAALEAGLIDRALRCESPRIRLERIGSQLYLKREGELSPKLALPAKDNVVRVDMRHAYRWGFRRETG